VLDDYDDSYNVGEQQDFEEEQYGEMDIPEPF
jgi:hypothetical protein